MARTYTPRLLVALFSILYIIPTLVGAHLIEVVAGKKECFFEDLNKNDKVPIEQRYCCTDILILFIDDSNLPSGRGRTLGY